MIKFPYGIADFLRIRRDGMVYVDRTAHLRDVENLGDVLVFLRPRRFGKSLWLHTLATYYDVRHAGDFDRIFGGLAIHRSPTGFSFCSGISRWSPPAAALRRSPPACASMSSPGPRRSSRTTRIT